MVCRVLYLREEGANPSQKLVILKRGGCWVNTTPTDISRKLKDAVRFLGPSLGFIPKDVSEQSLHVAGAMALL